MAAEADHDLSCDELDAIAKVCSELDKEADRPPFLQGFLAYRLRDRFPRLATHLETFTADQMDWLWDQLFDRTSADYWTTA